jgi:hypothetical protein
MTRGRSCQNLLVVLLVAVLLIPAPLRAQTTTAATAGAACAANGGIASTGNSFLLCVSGVWVVEPVTIGTQTASCTSSLAGQVQWTGSVLQVCNGSSWSTLAGGGLTGSGTTNYLARWTPNGSTLGIGATYDNGTSVGIGTTAPSTFCRSITVRASRPIR